MNHIIEFTESTIFQKKKIVDILDDIDTYVKRVHKACDLMSTESSKEEYLYQTEKDEIMKYMDDLDSEKQLLWVSLGLLVES